MLVQPEPDTRRQDAKPLPPRYDLRNHSPTGFAWGYGGSGLAQLALALAYDVLGDDARALGTYQKFKFRWIAALPVDKPWDPVSGAELRDMIADVKKDRAAIRNSRDDQR